MQLRRRLLEPPNGTAPWTVDAWATASCWNGLLDHFTALAVVAHDGDAPACAQQILHIDRALQAVSLGLADIPLPGGAACAEAVELMRAEFGSGGLPDPELMDHVGEWIAHAVTAGAEQDDPIRRSTA